MPNTLDYELTLPVTFTYHYTPRTPEYIPPYSKPENYDPGSESLAEISVVRLGTIDITDALDDEAIDELSEYAIEQEEGR